jgi:penicillin-binding protein 1C
LIRTGKIVRALLAITFLGGVGGIVAIWAVPLPARLLADRSAVVEMRDGEIAHVFLSSDDKWRLPVDVERVDPAFVRALIALEDRRYFGHPGVDPLALARAALSNVTSGRRVSGGSTITMQLARLLEPRPRTVSSKLVEAFRALQLEARLDKRRILEAYLSLAPYGENLEGVESAALAYFGHTAAHLSPVEIATLLAVPQGPARHSPRPENTARLAARTGAILAKLGLPGEPLVPRALRPMPRRAPHAAGWLRRRGPGQGTIRATLDAGAQRTTEEIVRLHAGDLRRRGIHNAAVVVVEHATRDVVALVGNLDFADDAHGGQIAMFDRPRSPGSTLKPFLYALAIDRGLASPAHLVADVPQSYGTYRPRNFDETWNGLVTMREALARSLNLPFVDLLARFGVEPFLAELARAGVRSPRQVPGHYGLSLVAGGIEATPLEIAGLYATLAAGGRHRPLRFTAGDARAPEVTVLGEGAAYLTRQALATRDRPDFPSRRRLTGAPAEIHWKTGTSFGLRDAWAVGSGPRHTVAVWTGNVDNAASAELVGSEAAGPLLFDVLEALADRSRIARPEAPAPDLAWIEVCAHSGHLPGPACGRRARTLAPVSAVPAATCPYHVTHEVDVATGLAVTPGCRGEGPTEARSFVVYPSGVRRWMADNGRALPEAPSFPAGCEPGGRGVEIVRPAGGQVVVLIPGLAAAEQEIALEAETSAEEISWFIDGELLRTAPARQRVFWTPTPGRHELVAIADGGGKARRVVEVRGTR